ncbi:MAG TPA: Rne/Rng family ribonuclease [Desulfobacterales bacterium]|nr:Rne/Rng family ribonuclease [Desulfobacterales bacterium]
MTTKMLINAVEQEEFRVAVVKDGLLEEFFIETSTGEDKTGNIYKGIIEKVEPSLQACFVNIGLEKNGFLSASEIHPEYFSTTHTFKGDKPPPIEKLIKKGQEVLVQITKEMPGRKGAHLTTYISLASRFLVLTPGRPNGGISKKIQDKRERERLKALMSQMKLPQGVGYIVRTAALGQKKRELSKDLNRLLRMWNEIKKRVEVSPPLTLIYQEQDVCLRALRDYFTPDIHEILVDDKETYSKVKAYMKIISPRYQRRVKLYKDPLPIFDKYDIESQIETIFSNHVNLKSGGYIVINPTEALISIDVNSGKGMLGKDLETLAFRTNLEAAREIARQIRLRDMGGLIVIDFIDMKDRSHIRQVEKVLREEIRKDKAKIDMTHISKFGLLELTRERLRPPIESRRYETCPHCQGRGLVQSVEAASISVLRRISVGVSTKGVERVMCRLPLGVATYLQNKKRRELAELEGRYGVEIHIEGNSALAPGQIDLHFLQETS